MSAENDNDAEKEPTDDQPEADVIPNPPSDAEADKDKPWLDEDRRDFMVKAGSIALGGLMVAVPVGAGVTTFISPLMKESAKGLVIRLAAVKDLPDDGTPKRYDVVAEKKDAWMKYSKKPIGGVYLRKLEDKSVVAFNTSCPHAGCSVGFQPDQGETGGYYCPCHKSQFNLDGSQGTPCVSARGLDALEIDQEKLAEGEIWVTFVNYRAGIADQIAVS